MSIGIAFSADGVETADVLLQNADLALYRAKQAGRARFEVFGDQLRQQVAVRHELEHALRRAILLNELQVHFQPIVSGATGEVVSFEALVRWQRPGYGLVPPVEFIPIAEETGLIVELGEWVLAHACREAVSWTKRWPDRRVGLSVNLSGHQVLNGDVAELVQSTLDSSGLDPRLLTLELTESTLIDHSANAEPILRSLRDLGVNLAIDDFGTGYSSLTYLRALPINIVKIDQSFVRAIGTEREDTAIVAAVINLARNLSLHVVAEGIETPEQLATLVHLNCELLQGYLFSRPQPARDLDQLVERAGYLALHRGPLTLSTGSLLPPANGARAPCRPSTCRRISKTAALVDISRRARGQWSAGRGAGWDVGATWRSCGHCTARCGATRPTSDSSQRTAAGSFAVGSCTRSLLSQLSRRSPGSVQHALPATLDHRPPPLRPFRLDADLRQPSGTRRRRARHELSCRPQRCHRRRVHRGHPWQIRARTQRS